MVPSVLVITLCFVELYRDDEIGFWKLEATEDEKAIKPDYIKALPLYLNGLDSLFSRARKQDEAQVILSLLGIKGSEAAGWDAYDTTVEAIQAATHLHNETGDSLAARHLSLRIYGHIVEAAAPYDLLANLIRVAQGGRARMAPFSSEGGGLLTPGRKLELIGLGAEEVGNQAARPLLAAIWHRQLRNGVFHADYAIHGSEIRLVGDGEALTLEEFEALSGRAHGYHDAMIGLRRHYRGLYMEPKIVPAGPIAPGQNLTIIVRKGDGAVGVKDALTPAERAAGGIPFRYACLFPDEIAMIEADPELALLPARPRSDRSFASSDRTQ